MAMKYFGICSSEQRNGV